MGLNEGMKSSAPKHPINYAARVSGVSTHAIRIWERRYDAVTPERSASGQRLYSDADIDRLRLLRRGTEAGHAISRLAALRNDELRAIIRDAEVSPGADTGRATPSTPVSTEVAPMMEQCRNAIATLDRGGFDRVLGDARARLPQVVLVEELIAPLMHWVGNAWQTGQLGVAHEHLATATLRAFVDHMHRDALGDQTGPIVIVTTPAHQRHEIGAMLASLVAVSEGWQASYFGPDMPAVDIARCAVAKGARAIALSAPLAGREDELLRELLALVGLLPESTAVIVGGDGVFGIRADLETSGVHFAGGLSELRAVLRRL